MKHILVVDAVATNLKCAKEILKGSYEITTSKSEIHALELLKEITPDLILLDMDLPQMDGLTALKWLKSKPEIAHIPVVLQAVVEDEEKEKEGLQLGAADFIYKPYDPDTLRLHLEKVLLQKKVIKSREFSDLFRTYDEQRKQLEEEVSKAGTGSLVIFSINHFDDIIEKFGKLAGEELMYKVVTILKEEAGVQNAVYCVAADKIGIFLRNSDQQNEVKTIVRRMIASVEFEVSDFFGEEHGIKISLLAGIARKPRDGHSYSELYVCSDKALYFLSQSGKRGYYFYSVEQSEKQSTEEKRDPLFVQQIQQMMIDGRSDGEEKESFEKACQLLSLYMKSKKQKAQVLWFVISGTDEEEERLEATKLLEKVITDSLRKGDMAIPTGDNQFVVILYKATMESGDRVAERICNKWNEQMTGETFRLTNELRSV